MGTDYVRFTEFIEQHTGHVHQQVEAILLSRCLNLKCIVLFLQKGTYTAFSLSLIFNLLSPGAPPEPAEPKWVTWDIPKGFLHWPTFHVAALQTSITRS